MEMVRTQLISLLFFALIALVVVGCGGSDADPNANGDLVEQSDDSGRMDYADGETADEDLDGEEILSEQPAPDFSVDGFDLANHAGDIVVLNFWATWNEASVEGMGALTDIHEELGSEGVTIAGIMLDEGGQPTLDEWQAEHTASYPLFADPDHQASSVFGSMEFLPATVIVDREGMIREQHTGKLTQDELLDLLGPILIESDEPFDDDAIMESDSLAVQTLLPEDVPNMIADGAMLVDIRTDEERDSLGLIPVAEHRPLPRLGAEDLPANYAMPVIFIGEDEDAVARAAENALDWGYASVYLVQGGTSAWQAAGLPLEAPRPIPEDEPLPMQAVQTVIG